MELAAFKKPPLNELVIGVQFEKLPEFPLPEYQKIWDVIGGAKEYPLLENQPRLLAGLQNGEPLEFNPTQVIMPRVWFSTADSCHLLQYQSDRIHFNWRAGENYSTYPRYEPICEKFLLHYQQINNLIQDRFSRSLNPTTLEMSYTNLIPKEDVGDFDNLDSLLNQSFWKPNALQYANKMQGFQCAYRVSVDDYYAALNVNISTVINPNTGEQFFRIDLNVQGKCIEEYSEGVEGLKRWYDGIRIVIVDSFDKMTTENMHQKWGRYVRGI